MVRARVDRVAKLAEIRAYRAELAALIPITPTDAPYASDWYLLVPPGVVYVNALAGEVYMDGRRYWLADLDLDAWAATVV